MSSLLSINAIPYAEARSKVPDEFVVQHSDRANPPTLLLVLQVHVHDVNIRSIYII